MLMPESKESFYWGVATCGYQSEGGYNAKGQPQNNWARAEHLGTVMRTGRGPDFWKRYEEDLDRCAAMGLTAFRLSIEWARVQPTLTAEKGPAPEFDHSALEHYAAIIAACRRRGIEPVVTLHHFTHPAWLGQDAWLEDDTAAAFAYFAQYTLQFVNRCIAAQYQEKPVHWVITINEPNILVLNTYVGGNFPAGHFRGRKAGFIAYDHLFTGHILAYQAIKRLYQRENWPTPMVTLNTFCSEIYWSEKFIYDLLTSRERGISADKIGAFFQDEAARLSHAIAAANLPFQQGLVYFLGKQMHRLADWIGRKDFTAERFPLTLNALRRADSSSVLDYLAVDYYDPFAGHIFRPPDFLDLEFSSRSIHAWLMDGFTSKWWNWRCLPEGLHFFCRYYHEVYKRPILIAENGMALRRHPDNSHSHARADGLTRSEFLRAHVEQVNRLRQEGVSLTGYLHWSLTDNYEWGSFTPRFGLFSIDYANASARQVEDQLGDRPSETYRELIQQAKELPH